MRRLLLVAVASVAMWTQACGGDDSAQVQDAVTDTTASELEVQAEVVEEIATPLVDLPWVEMDGGLLTGVKSIKGLACSGSSVFLSVDSSDPETTGTWMLDLASQQPLTKFFEGYGSIAATETGLLVATYGGPNATAAVVLVQPGADAVDQGFAVQATEVKELIYSSGKTIMMAKDWSNAQYTIFRGGLNAGAFEQLGKTTDETGMSIYTDGTDLYFLTLLNGTVGAACRQLPITAGPEDTWVACQGFPEWVQTKPTDPFSIRAEVFGSGSDMAAWFKVSNKGTNEYHVYAGAAGNYITLPGFPANEPSAWHHTGSDVLLGYVGGSGKSGAFAASKSGGEPARDLTEGLLSPAHEKDGVAAFCQSNKRLVAAWFAFGGGGSTVTLFQKSLD